LDGHYIITHSKIPHSKQTEKTDDIMKVVLLTGNKSEMSRNGLDVAQICVAKFFESANLNVEILTFREWLGSKEQYDVLISGEFFVAIWTSFSHTRSLRISLLSDPVTHSYRTKLTTGRLALVKKVVYTPFYLMFENLVHARSHFVLYQTKRDVDKIYAIYRSNSFILANHPKLYCDGLSHDREIYNEDIVIGWIATFKGEYLSFANALLKEILEILTANNLKIKILLAGKGAKAIYLDLESTFGSYLRIAHYVENLSEFYGCCDVTIGSGRKQYGLYNKVHESFFYGVPVISNSNGLYPMTSAERELCSFYYESSTDLERILLNIRRKKIAEKVEFCKAYSNRMFKKSVDQRDKLVQRIRDKSDRYR
jgi:hypothetical protein